MANAIVPGSYIAYQSRTGAQPAPWLQNARSVLATAPPPDERIKLLDVILQKGIAGGTGIALAVLQAELRNGLDVHKIPIDLATSFVADIAGYAMNSPATIQVGNSCFTVYSFRKSLEVLGALKTLIGATSVSGEKEPEVTATVHGEVVETVENDVVVKAGEIFTES